MGFLMLLQVMHKLPAVFLCLLHIDIMFTLFVAIKRAGD